MSDVRCRACGAAVPTEAQWCSLCFADLREPTPARERISVPAAPAEAETATAAATPAPNGVRPDPDALLGLPARSAESSAGTTGEGAPDPAPAVATAAAVKWPCSRCGAKVAISLDDCPSCGAGFLDGALSSTSAHLPIVGDVGRFSRNQRVALGFGLSLVVMVVLLVLATIGGHLI